MTVEEVGTLSNYGGLDIADQNSLQNNGFLFNSGELTIDDGGFLENDGTLQDAIVVTISGTVHNTGELASCGMLDVIGTLTNDGDVNCDTLTVENGGTLINNNTLECYEALTNNGTLVSGGTLYNYGTMTISDGGYFSAAGPTVIDGNVQNYGSFQTSFMLDVVGTLTNYGELDTSNLTVEPGGLLDDFGKIENHGPGSLDDQGTVVVEKQGSLQNDGMFSVDNSGMMIIYGDCTNSSSLTIADGGSIRNYGTLENSGALNADTYCALENYGAVENSGTLTVGNESNVDNYGLLENQQGTVAVDGGGLISNWGGLNNLGSLDFSFGSELDNYGTMANFSTVELDGSPSDFSALESYCVLQQNGDITDLECTLTMLECSTSTFNDLDSVTLTAAVVGGSFDPSDTVTFYDGDVSLGSAALVNGVATLTTSGIGAGSQNLTAVFGGDASNLGSTSATVYLGAMGIAITNSNNAPVEGSPVALGSSVFDGDGDPITADNYFWTVTDPSGTTSDGGNGSGCTFTPGSDGQYTVSLTAIVGGASLTATTTVSVQEFPMTVALSNAVANSDGSISDTAAINDQGADAIAAGYNYAWTVTKTVNNETSTFLTQSGHSGTSSTIQFTPNGPGNYSINVIAAEVDGDSQSSANQSVTVNPPTVSISGTTVTNGAPYAVFTVSVSPPVPWAVSVGYMPSDGASSPSQGYDKAEGGVDYAAQGGTLNIPADATSAQISIGLFTATVAEPTEDFYVTLSNPLNALVSTGAGQATGWIQNNLPWVVNSTGDLPATDSAASPWTGQNNALGDDNPECTLRSILQYLNANNGGTVNFGIPTADPNFNGSYYTITDSALPAIQKSITVAGSSQPGFPLGQNGAPIIDVAGGFTVSAGPSTIANIAVTSSGGNGITISDAQGNDTIFGLLRRRQAGRSNRCKERRLRCGNSQLNDG